MNVERHVFVSKKPSFLSLKEQRGRLGLTQQQVADIASVNIRLYQRLENGERSLDRTSLCIGVAIADVLELDVHDLVSTLSVDEYLKGGKKLSADTIR